MGFPNMFTCQSQVGYPFRDVPFLYSRDGVPVRSNVYHNLMKTIMVFSLNPKRKKPR